MNYNRRARRTGDKRGKDGRGSLLAFAERRLAFSYSVAILHSSSMPTRPQNEAIVLNDAASAAVARTSPG